MKINFKQKLDLTKIKYFVTSDLHFYHKNVMKHCPETRPYADVNEMNMAIIDAWNSVVGENDVVFHVGDFYLDYSNKAVRKERIARLLECLNGTIIFSEGNHDDALQDIPGLQKHHYLEVRFNGTKVCMSHYTHRAWNGSHHGSVMLFGHSHGSMPEYGRSMDVGWDAVGGRILPLGEVVNYLINKPIETEDKH